MTTSHEVQIWLRCAQHPRRFIHHYCSVYDATTRAWQPFRLWSAQKKVLGVLRRERQTIILKARQLGLSWLCVGYALWLLQFHPPATVLVFSRTDVEATEMVDRVRGMHARLPGWMQRTLTTDNEHELVWSSGSRLLAFATTKHSARSFTASLVIIDEAEFIQWLPQLMAAVKPTIDAGGQLIVLSTINKEIATESEFRRIWNIANTGQSSYHPIFLPWSARPGRDEGWYRAQVGDYDADTLRQEYPATPEEALAPRQSSARFLAAWITAARAPTTQPQPDVCPPALVYTPPQEGTRYLVAADPAEGHPGSDPSAATVFERHTWREVAVLHGQYEPHVFAAHLVALAKLFHNAVICCERNNHGHAVHVALRALGAEHLIYKNPFDQGDGWLTSSKTKVLAVDNAAQTLKDGAVQLHTEGSLQQLAEFSALTLAAPPGHHDDLAMSVILGLAALRWPSAGEAANAYIPAQDPLAMRERHPRHRGSRPGGFA